LPFFLKLLKSFSFNSGLSRESKSSGLLVAEPKVAPQDVKNFAQKQPSFGGRPPMLVASSLRDVMGDST
jgi:hypothetical protein